MALLKIEWSNTTDLGPVLYQDGYKNRIYLDVELERPDYNYTSEVDTNGENKEIPKFKKWEKVYKFTVWMSEDLVDAFTFMQQHDTIEVTPPTGETFSVADNGMRVEPEWEEAGCLAKVTVSFVVDYVVSTACNENMDTDCLCATTVDFDGFLDISAIGATSGTAGDLVVFYDSEVIPDKKYTGSMYQLQTTGLFDWVLYDVDANKDCFYDKIKTGDNFIYDGTFWRLMPGYITALSYSAPNVWLRGWAPEGSFVTVWYDAGLGWVDAGDYTADGLEDLGLYFSLGVSGTIPFRLEVWNHSCDYGYTDSVNVIIP